MVKNPTSVSYADTAASPPKSARSYTRHDIFGLIVEALHELKDDDLCQKIEQSQGGTVITPKVIMFVCQCIEEKIECHDLFDPHEFCSDSTSQAKRSNSNCLSPSNPQTLNHVIETIYAKISSDKWNYQLSLT